LKCGTLVQVTKATRKICEDCKEQDRKRKEGKKRNKYGEFKFVVIYDPDKDYVYPKGASISPIEKDLMVKPCYHAFTPGMILKRGRHYYKVVEDHKQKQNLVPIAAPDYAK